MRPMTHDTQIAHYEEIQNINCTTESPFQVTFF